MLSETPFYARPLYNLPTQSVQVAVNESDPQALITAVHFSQNTSRVADCFATFILSSHIVPTTVNKLFRNVGTLSNGQVVVAEFYEVRSIVDTLFKARLLDAKLEDEVHRLEQAGICAESLGSLNPETAQERAVIEQSLDILRSCNERRIKCLIVDELHTQLARTPRKLWPKVLEAFRTVPQVHSLSILRLAAFDGYECLSEIATYLKNVDAEDQKAALEYTNSLLLNIRPRHEFIEPTLYNVADLIQQGHTDAIEFTLTELKESASGEMVATTLAIMRHAVHKPSAQALIQMLLKAKASLRPLYNLVVPHEGEEDSMIVPQLGNLGLEDDPLPPPNQTPRELFHMDESSEE